MKILNPVVLFEHVPVHKYVDLRLSLDLLGRLAGSIRLFGKDYRYSCSFFSSRVEIIEPIMIEEITNKILVDGKKS